MKREQVLKNPKYRKEDFKEKQYFLKICKIVDEFLNNAHEEEKEITFGYNDFSDSFNPSILGQHQDAIDKVNLWQDVRNKPYFARLDYGKNKKIYIGKNAIDGLVIDWRDEICNLYYQYNIYISNKDYNISLVRDFEIIAGNYCGFRDKYSTKENGESNEFKNDIISDKFLMKIISTNRNNKKTHDIINTIQHNQYEIIKYDKLKNIIVLGCAGSGKTMIMLHRLSYMVFNNKKINLKDIYIISPTKLLNLESNELSRTLEINTCNRLTLNSFNVSIIKDYYSLNEVYNANTFKEIKLNTLIDSDFIKYIYSNTFINIFKDDIIDIILSDSKKREKVLESEKANLLNEYEYFCKDEVKLIDISDVYVKNKCLNEIYENIKKVVLKIPLENAKEKIKQIDKILNDNKDKISKDKLLKDKKDVLESLVKDWNMSKKTIYTSKNGKALGDISVKDEIFNEVFGYFNVLAKNNSNNKDILEQVPHLKNKFSSILELINRYKRMVEKMKRFEDFVYRRNFNYFSEIINHLIIDIKNKNKIDLRYTYEFEVFLHLLACSEIFNTLYFTNSYIFMDEFQDCALSELELYTNIFPNAVFNLFGDIKQCINPKGLNEREFKQIICDSCKVFSINENYRNSCQITEYINSKFSLNMMPIGINGSVEHYDINNVTTKIKLIKSNRTALIIKDITFYEKIKTKKCISSLKNINLIKDDDCKVEIGVLNIIPINLAKGLEFEEVYVIPEKMNENEVYVAYTRALNKLYILESK